MYHLLRIHACRIIDILIHPVPEAVFGYPNEGTDALVVDVDVMMACSFLSRVTRCLAERRCYKDKLRGSTCK